MIYVGLKESLYSLCLMEKSKSVFMINKTLLFDVLYLIEFLIKFSNDIHYKNLSSKMFMSCAPLCVICHQNRIDARFHKYNLSMMCKVQNDFNLLMFYHCLDFHV